ncbi:MAG: bifunctional riboflavin kinase/FAD synthetase [Cyanobacteria bacterium J06598_3]
MWITSSLKAAKAPVNIALGNFDGVHLGHQRVMAQILSSPIASAMSGATSGAVSSGAILSASPLSDSLSAAPQAPFSAQSITALHRGVIASGHSHLSESDSPEAIELPIGNAAASPEAFATVVTFSPHPQEYFSGVSKPLLTPVAEKTWQLAQLGIHQLVMLPFDQALASLSPEAFVEQILIDGLQAKRISVGSDFRFGKGRSGDAEGLRAIAAKHGIPVTLVPLKHEKGDRISSSRIRQALDTGNLEEATHLLGRPYTLTGRVVQGKQLGRTIGFPTANLQIPTKKYLPRTGVYSVWVYGAEDGACTPSSAQPLKGVMNIGNRPTVDGQALSVEVHVMDWTGDLYGKLITASLEGFVRAEQKFDSLDGLKAQIAQDCQVAIATLTQ